MLVNTSSAIEYNTVNDYNTNLLDSKLEYIDIFIVKLRKAIKDLNSISIDSKSTYGLEELSNELSELRNYILDNPSPQIFIRKLLRFIVSLLFSIIGTIFGILIGKIFGPLIVLIVRILTAPAVLLAKIIAFIVDLFTPNYA
jgi:hypothetical protein